MSESSAHCSFDISSLLYGIIKNLLPFAGGERKNRPGVVAAEGAGPKECVFTQKKRKEMQYDI